MCACENGERCMYHAEMLHGYQTMWKALRAIADGKIEGDPGEAAERSLDGLKYLHL